MTTSQPLVAEADPPSPLEEFTPTFYIGHHESKRPLPVTDFVLRQAQDAGVSVPSSASMQAPADLFSMTCSPVLSLHLIFIPES